jgi:H+/Cl- antiporter ClcA
MHSNGFVPLRLRRRIDPTNLKDTRREPPPESSDRWQSYCDIGPPFHATGKWLVSAAIVGVAAGLGAIAFDSVEQLVRHVAMERITDYAPPAADGEHRLFATPDVELSFWRIIPVLAMGGLRSGMPINRLAQAGRPASSISGVRDRCDRRSSR